MKLIYWTVVFVVLPLLARDLTDEEMGAHLYKVRPGYVSPHCDWGKNIPEEDWTKVLFIVPNYGFRDIIELSQRRPFRQDVFGRTTHKGDIPEETRQAELISMLDKNPSVIVIGKPKGGDPFTTLSNEMQYKILELVNEGAGLIFVGPMEKMPYRKVYAKPLDTPDFLRDFSPDIRSKEPIDYRKTLKAYRLGKGVVVYVNYVLPACWGGGMALTPVIRTDRQYAAIYENDMSLLLRTIQYAAEHGAPAKLTASVSNENLAIRAAAGKTISLRVRDTENNLVFSSDYPVLVTDIWIPEKVGGGTFFCDLILRDGPRVLDSRTLTFRRQPVSGEMKVKIPAGFHDFSRSLPVSIHWEKPLAAEAVMRVEMIDFPEQRIWFRKDFSVPAGKTGFSAEIDRINSPNLFGYIRCSLHDKGFGQIGKAEVPVRSNDRSPGLYFQYGWDTVGTPELAKQLNYLLGWKGMLTFNHGEREWTLTPFNYKLIDFSFRICLNKGKNGEINQGNFIDMFSAGKLKKEMEELRGDTNFYRPEVQELLRKIAAYRVDVTRGSNVVVYSLGDENSYSYEAGFGPSDSASFRTFLLKKYGSIVKFNAEHGTKYTSFSDVPHLSLKDALKAKDFPSWFDHREYIEQMYADEHHFLADEIKKKDPLAVVGAEGSMPGNLEKTTSKLDFWGPYHDLLEAEALRSFGSEKLRSIWWGYASPSPYPNNQLEFLVCGKVNACSWYITPEDGSKAGAISHDGLPTPCMAKFLRILDQLRFGQAQMLVATPLASAKSLIYFSHPSNSAAILDERCPRPSDSANTLIYFHYRNGIPFEMVSENTLSRLKEPQYKVLYLCGVSALSNAETESIIDFVKRGGLVIADRNPGILNEFLRPMPKNRMSELFGDITFEASQQPKILDKVEAVSADGARLVPPKVLGESGKTYWNEKSVGKGKAVLANFNFGVASATAGNASFDRFLLAQLKNVGIVPALKISGNRYPVTLRTRRGKDFDSAAILLAERDAGEKITLELPRKYHVYDNAAGYAGFTDTYSFRDSSNPLRIVCWFENKQNVPEPVPCGVKFHGGEVLKITAANIPAGRILSLRGFDPNGKELKTRNIVCETLKIHVLEFPFAYTDPAGKYKFILKDQATGLEKTFEVTLD